MCVCVCEREREREREIHKGGEFCHAHQRMDTSIFANVTVGYAGLAPPLLCGKFEVLSVCVLFVCVPLDFFVSSLGWACSG